MSVARLHCIRAVSSSATATRPRFVGALTSTPHTPGEHMSIVIRSAPRKALIAFFVVTLFSSATARAQEQRLRISFAPSVATVSGDAALALDGSLGYRFSRHLWFEGDATWIDAAAGGFRNRDLVFDQRALNELGLAESLRRGAMFGHGRFAGLPAVPTLPADIAQLHASTDGS